MVGAFGGGRAEPSPEDTMALVQVRVLAKLDGRGLDALLRAAWRLANAANPPPGVPGYRGLLGIVALAALRVTPLPPPPTAM